MNDAQLLIHATDTETGEQWSFQDAADCPTVEKLMTGDGPVTWTYPFTQFRDRLPPRHAHVRVEDNDGLVQTARIVRRAPPATDLCEGPCSITAEGYAASLSDRKLAASTYFGPVWTGLSLAHTPEDVVVYAVTQLGEHVSYAEIGSTDLQLSDTEDFQGKTAQDIINSMTAVGAGLATPFAWSVKNGIFRWGPIDLAPRYQVMCADGAVVTPVDDASKLYSRVVVIYGKNQTVSFPNTISYSQIPTIVDLVVNASYEITSEAMALSLAQGLYARLSELELGWSATITIPGTTAIEWIGHGPIAPWRVPAQAAIRIPDLEPGARSGSKHAMRDVQLMTQCRWDGPQNQLVVSCGEIRNPSDFIRRIIARSNANAVTSLYTPGLSVPQKAVEKIFDNGPGLPDPGTDETGAPLPTPIRQATVPLSSEHNQPLPSHDYPKPMALIHHAYSPDGEVFTAGLLETAANQTKVPPGVITHWELESSFSGTITIQIHRAAKDATGAYVREGSGDAEQHVPGALVGQIFLTSAKANRGTAFWRIPEESLLIYTLVDPIVNVKDWHLNMIANRVVPGFPVGYDTVPAIGEKSV